MGINIIEEELGRKSVFMNEEKLSTDYVPPHLIHRDAELRQLAQFFRVLIQAPGSCSKTVSIVGHVGTGKTAIAKRFGDFLERFPIYVDGMIATMNAIHEKYLDPHWVSPRIFSWLKENGYSSPFRNEMITLIEELTTKNREKVRDVLTSYFAPFRSSNLAFDSLAICNSSFV